MSNEIQYNIFLLFAGLFAAYILKRIQAMRLYKLEFLFDGGASPPSNVIVRATQV